MIRLVATLVLTTAAAALSGCAYPGYYGYPYSGYPAASYAPAPAAQSYAPYIPPSELDGNYSQPMEEPAYNIPPAVSLP